MLDVVFGYFLLLLYIGRYLDNMALKTFPILLLLMLAFKYFQINKGLKLRSSLQSNHFFDKVFLGLIVVITVGIIRNNNPESTSTSRINDTLTFISFILLSYQVFNHINLKYKGDLNIFFRVMILPFNLFIIANFAAWLLNIQVGDAKSLDIGKSLIISRLGIDLPRVQFPFANGINSYATLVGGVFTVELGYYFLLKRRSKLGFVSLISTFITLLLTDSRSGIIYPIIIIFLLYLISKRKSISGFKFFPYLYVLGPLILASLLPLLATSDLLSDISRSQEDFATGNSRFLIWGIAINEFLTFDLIHLVGYGIFGHYASGASAGWAEIFSYMENSEIVHPHNTFLSMLFDYGYIGVILFLLVLIGSTSTVVRSWKANRSSCLFFLSFLSYFMLISITESFVGLYYLDSIYFVFMFLFFAMAINQKKSISN